MWESVAIALAETMAESGHEHVDKPPFAPTFPQRAQNGDSSTNFWALLEPLSPINFSTPPREYAMCLGSD